MRNTLKLTLATSALLVASVSHAELLYGVTFDNQLITFDSATPNNILSSFNITGRGGEVVLGLDFRPATGQLYTLLGDGRLGTVSTTGAFTSVGSSTVQLNGSEFAFDFNPTSDRIRVISNTAQNLSLDPANGATTANTNATITGSSSVPQISGVAYTNNFFGATSTTLYGIDAQTNTLVSTVTPASGVFTTVGSLGFNAAALNGFDISGTTSTAYASVQTTAGAGSSLYTINLATGTASLVGNVGSGSAVTQLRGLTVAPAPVPEPASIAAIGIGLAAMLRRRRNKNS